MVLVNCSILYERMYLFFSFFVVTERWMENKKKRKEKRRRRMNRKEEGDDDDEREDKEAAVIAAAAAAKGSKANTENRKYFTFHIFTYIVILIYAYRIVYIQIQIDGKNVTTYTK